MSGHKDEAVFYPHIHSDISLYSPHIRTVTRGWRCGRHLHQRLFELLFMERGELNAYTGTTERKLAEGDLLFIPPMQLHGYEAVEAGEATFRIIHVQFSGEDTGLDILENGGVRQFAADSPVNAALRGHARGLFEGLRQEPLRRTGILIRVLQILETLGDYARREAAEPGLARDQEAVGSLAYRIAREIEGLLQRSVLEESGRDVTPAELLTLRENGNHWLEEIAQRLNISRRHCHRVFRETYGISPRHYLMILKQQEAMRMLNDEDMTIEQVAHRLGYANVPSFTRQFAAWVGCTPGVFRRERPDTARFLDFSFPAGE
ncbi:helix-turn-helix domain-containing protein [Gorillibacterium sp. sgz500922]|uniref:helix-turn-helix domain-containing protein n=1 Tax=Gorillibacterium sp. sgz500922 TaxID=3446694 RepID=UPI003F67AE12